MIIIEVQIVLASWKVTFFLSSCVVIMVKKKKKTRDKRAHFRKSVERALVALRT